MFLLMKVGYELSYRLSLYLRPKIEMLAQDHAVAIDVLLHDLQKAKTFSFDEPRVIVLGEQVRHFLRQNNLNLLNTSISSILPIDAKASRPIQFLEAFQHLVQIEGLTDIFLSLLRFVLDSSALEVCCNSCNES